MPGKIMKVMVELGEKVTQGQTLLILEAMKMEHAIKANCDGTIKQIFISAGQLVEGGNELIEIEEKN